jgi:hypothetical protein
MRNRGRLAILAVCVTLGTISVASAQQAPKKTPFDSRFEPEELTPGQIQRAQENEPKTAPKPAPAARAIACNGAFAKDSNHLKLTSAFKPENVTVSDVDAGEGRTVKASVLFPKDAKRRLEVWWLNENERAGVYLIVINGQSTWTAPKGMHLGLSFPAVEKLNGKPFKVHGLKEDGSGMISDWQGGSLEQLPGGCRFGISFRPAPKTNPDALTVVSGDQEFASTETSIRAIKPTISEILVGY